MAIDAAMVKDLREKTGAGIMDCKRALNEAQGDLNKAGEILRKWGLAAAAKKSARIAAEGLVTSYLHPGNKIGVLLEINCETDFVARTPEFSSLAKDLCMQIAASRPLYLRREDVPEEVSGKEQEIYREEMKNKGKPEKVVEKIVEGKLEKFYAEVCLLEQPFVKDPDTTVEALIKDHIARLGENIVVRRFSRFQLGEGLLKRNCDLEEEVKSQL
jgi:elongation factor Ts